MPGASQPIATPLKQSLQLPWHLVIETGIHGKLFVKPGRNVTTHLVLD
jgi:hypothetical protein